MILKEKAIRLARRILAKQRYVNENDEDETNKSEENVAMDVEEDIFLSGFGFFPDIIESHETDSKPDEIQDGGACISEQGEGGQEEALDTAGTNVIK